MKPSFIFFLLLTVVYGRSQNYNGLGSTALNRVTLRYNDTVCQFFAVKSDKKIKTKNDQIYFWYKPDTILQTMGSYDGRLLDGVYKIFYPNKNLMQEGKFSNGIKAGEWKNWFPNGKLKSVTHWEKGKKNGPFENYNEQGNKVQTGNYVNDQLDGTIHDFLADGKEEQKKYKNGSLQEKKQKTKKTDNPGKDDNQKP